MTPQEVWEISQGTYQSRSPKENASLKRRVDNLLGLNEEIKRDFPKPGMLQNSNDIDDIPFFQRRSR